MTKVALVSHTSAFSGAERMLYNLACMLLKNDSFFPVVLLPGDKDQNSLFYQACEETGIETCWMGGNTGYKTWYINSGKSDGSNWKKATIHAIEDVEKLLLRIKVDLLLNNTLTNQVAVLAAAELGIPVVTWVHGVLDNTNLNKKVDATQRLLYDRVQLSLSEQIICCSNWVKAFYQSVCIRPIQTVHNWSPELGNNERRNEDNGDNQESRAFVCLNTFEKNKGIMTLLNAVSILKNVPSCPQFTVQLYGSGDPKYTYEIKEFIERKRISNSVVVCSRTNDIVSVYQRAFCLIQPSIIEPFGMTIIEAMSCELPTISTKSGGPSETVVDGETGYLIERNDPNALAEKMLFLLKHPDIAKEFGKKGRKRFEECFSEDVANIRMIEILKQAAKNYKGVDAYQQLVLDNAIQQLISETEDNRSSETQTKASAWTGPQINPDELCFSGIIKKPRKYAVSCYEGLLGCVGLLFADLSGNAEKGIITIRIYQKKQHIAEVTMSGKELQMNNWSYFRFTPVHIDSNKLIIEIIPKNMDGLGVFEITQRRSIVYKAFNKLGCPIKGKDVLQVALLQG